TASTWTMDNHQEIKGRLGSQHVQQVAALVTALGALWSEDKLPGTKRMARVPERIVAVVQRKPEAILIEKWAKVCGTSDAYEGQNKRLSLGVVCKTRIAADEVGALELLQKEAEEGLATFLKVPLRDLGADACKGRAPRGPLARGKK
ncbi:MAG: hypothetical protein ACKPKO_31905, partial [Candidatus Fonsibacter sp.]